MSLVLTEKAAQKYYFVCNHCNDAVISNRPGKPIFLEASLIGQAETNNPNWIFDWYIPKQSASQGETEIDDDGWLDYNGLIIQSSVEQGVDFKDLNRARTRVWAHTHPGKNPNPSNQDWETFKKFYSEVDFASMLILSHEEKNVFNYMRFETVYIGTKEGKEPVWVKLDGDNDDYVLLEKYYKSYEELIAMQSSLDAFKQKIIADSLPISFDFQIALTISNYHDLHETWLAEMKENIQQKYVYQTSVGYTQHNIGYQQSTIGVKYDDELEKEKIAWGFA